MEAIITVICPVYGAEKYIHRCVDSVIHQTFTGWNLVLIDDGSPDRCGDICDAYADKDKRIRVIHQKNIGVSATRNRGLDEVHTEYFYFWILMIICLIMHCRHSIRWPRTRMRISL